MQDSIEDYIQITRNTKDDSATENITLSKEILITQRKKECEDYAMKIVLFLLDGKLRPEIFLKCLKYITEEHYQDVVEERAISKLCGYPICGKKIPDMPKQKYIISTKVNKVYDISERKNYCSNFCYHASLFVKSQIESSPLWLRNHAEIPECKLMPTTTVATPGEEVDYGVQKTNIDLSQFTSITHFTQISLEEVGKIEKGSRKESKSNMKNKNFQNQLPLGVIEEDVDKESEKSHCDSNLDTNNVCPSAKNYVRNNNKKDKVRELLNRNKMEEYFDKLKITDLEVPQQIKYMNICKRLHMQELAEEKFDKAALGNSFKPLPNFKQLKEEVQELDLRENQGNTEECNVLPLVDVSTQNILRRKVFLTSINKTMKKLIVELKMDESYVMLCIQDLVKSFKLQAHNVIFKPHIWPLIAVILLNILCIKDINIKSQMEETRCSEHIELILSKYVGIKKIIEEILILLSDVNKFVERQITHE
ncbi:hypothetical protein Trydic_g16822 [Trypoxylus dichotomus]